MQQIESINKGNVLLYEVHDIFNLSSDINDEVERFLATLDKRAPAAVEKTSSVERKALPKSMKENQSFHKMRSTGKLTKLDNMAAGKAGLISTVDKKDAPIPISKKENQ